MEINSNGCFPVMFLLHHVFSRQEFQALPVFGYLNIPWKKPTIVHHLGEPLFGSRIFQASKPQANPRKRQWLDMGVSKNNVTPKSSILKGFCIINHPFWPYEMMFLSQF